MHGQIALGAVLVVITTVVHAFCTAGVLHALRMMKVGGWAIETVGTRVFVLSAVVIMMFLAAVVEVSIWAFTFLALGVIPDLEPALYFSTVTFTTLGYGDITLDASWRLLGSFAAANGTIMFGWTTALVFSVLQHMIADERAARNAAP